MTTTLFRGGEVRVDADRVASWLLVEDEVVRALGTSDEPPAADRVVDLAGGVLAPAFCDAHVHLPATGLYASGLDFRGVTAADTILAGFERHAREGRAFLFGGNFEDPLDRPLSRHELDRSVGESPALLARADMHSCVVSSALLAQLDLTGIEGVDRDADGDPSGYLREQAAARAWQWFDSNLPPDDQKAAIRAAARVAYAKGVAAVHEMFVVEWRGWNAFDLLRSVVDELALEVAVYCGTPEVDRVVALGLPRIGGDFFLDGSFGSHTAWLEKPYVSSPPSGSAPSGLSYRSDDELFEFFLSAHEAGLQVGVHAIGDAAIEQAIATWERVAEKVGANVVAARGHRIEHFECATDDHIRRAAALGLKASVQPAFDAFWGGSDGMYAQRIGPDRALQMNRFGTMHRLGVALGAGSDSTVTPLNPFLQMRSLRLHHVEEERVPAPDAFRMHTEGSFGLAFMDGGILEPDRPAHLCWLDRDPVTTDAEQLENTEVLGTWVRGARVWPEADAETA
ncbi:MAG TPA: amidohydrolase family protein [Actinomycetota bacterium]|nr:amidohydrolase family protein [Actinomycetota bacterium]